MKKMFGIIMMAVAVCFIAYGVVWASPFTVVDFQADVSYYRADTDGVVINVTPQNGWVQNDKLYFTDPGGTRTPVHVLVDDASLTVGGHTQKFRACKTATLWESERCSADSVPLAFTKPPAGTVPNAPTGTKLVAQ